MFFPSKLIILGNCHGFCLWDAEFCRSFSRGEAIWESPVQRAFSLFYKKEALSHLAISVFRREQGGELPGLPGEFWGRGSLCQAAPWAALSHSLQHSWLHGAMNWTAAPCASLGARAEQKCRGIWQHRGHFRVQADVWGYKTLVLKQLSTRLGVRES